MEIFKQYKQACSFLESLSHLETPFSYMESRDNLEVYLKRTQELLDRFGNPEKNLKYIHITGTAGKGSTVQLLHQSLQNAGYKVGSISSPATTTTLERILVGDKYIEPTDFVRIVEELKPIIEEMYLSSAYGKASYFDIMLAISLKYFQEQKCDYVILEVGMGGRYDSTNIIEKPLITAITNVGYDHTHLLGNSLKLIAREKAGIIKKNTHFFTTEKKPEILNIFEEVCEEEKAYFHKVESNHNLNEALVSAILNKLDIKNKHLNKAILEFKLPCRFEQVQDNPKIVLDGAHNVSKIKYSLKKIKDIQYKNLHVVFGAGKTKDAFGMLDLIEQEKEVRSITLTYSDSIRGKSFSLKEMKNFFEDKYPDINVLVNFNPHEAMGEVEKKADKDDLILAIGSLYLTGEIRKRWFSEEYIIENRKSF